MATTPVISPTRTSTGRASSSSKTRPASRDGELRKRRQVFLDRKQPWSPGLDALLKTKELTVPWKADTNGMSCDRHRGRRIAADDGWQAGASHRSPGFAHPVKGWFSLGIPNSVWIDDVKIWKVK
jgi:hypothetical protein